MTGKSSTSLTALRFSLPPGEELAARSCSVSRSSPSFVTCSAVKAPTFATCGKHAAHSGLWADNVVSLLMSLVSEYPERVCMSSTASHGCIGRDQARLAGGERCGACTPCKVNRPGGAVQLGRINGCRAEAARWPHRQAAMSATYAPASAKRSNMVR